MILHEWFYILYWNGYFKPAVFSQHQCEVNQEFLFSIPTSHYTVILECRIRLTEIFSQIQNIIKRWKPTFNIIQKFRFYNLWKQRFTVTDLFFGNFSLEMTWIANSNCSRLVNVLMRHHNFRPHFLWAPIFFAIWA